MGNQEYQNFIQGIIDVRGQGSDEVRYSERGCERHHILPKCMGGEPKNLTWAHHLNIIGLYPQEHFIAHKLLAEFYTDNISLTSAYFMMCNKGSNCNEQYVYTSEEYEEAKKLASKNTGKFMSVLWQNLSQEERNNITNKQQEGRNNKTQEEKDNWFNAIGESLNKRTPEQWEETRIKKQNTGANRTPEQKEQSRLKRQKTLKEHPEIEEERKRKEKITKSQKSKEEKAAIKRKISAAWKNMSEEDKIKREQKRLKTRQERGTNTSGKNNPRSKSIRCIETNEIYGCISDAAKSIGMKYSTFYKCLRLRIPDINGNTGEYIANKKEYENGETE